MLDGSPERLCLSPSHLQHTERLVSCASANPRQDRTFSCPPQEEGLCISLVIDELEGLFIYLLTLLQNASEHPLGFLSSPY